MANLNRAELIGRLGGDPEVRYMPNGDAVARLKIATSESWPDKDSGDRKERTEWHLVVCYRQLAEYANRHLAKGDTVFVAGSMRSRSWENKEGEKRYEHYVEASELQRLMRRAQKESAPNAGDGDGDSDS